MATLVPYTAPYFVASSNEISNNKITGVSTIGAKVFITDTGQWKVVGSDLTLSDFISGDVSGSAVGGYSTNPFALITRPAGDTTTYQAGDVWGDAATDVLTFSNCSRIEGGSGTIIGATFVGSANQATKLQGELWLFKLIPQVLADNAPFAPLDSDVLNCVGVIPFGSTWYVGNSTSGAGGNCITFGSPVVGQNASVTFKCSSSSTQLYGIVVVRNAYVPVASEILTITLNIFQD
jgi:hypothetical protein